MTIRHVACALLWTTTTVAPAADSGPAADTAAAPFTVFVATGDAANESVDFVTRRGALPTLYCFVPKAKWSRPTARLLRTLDQSIASAAPEGAIVAVWVTDDAAASKAYLPNAQQSLQFSRTSLTVDGKNPTGPPEWGINSDVDITIVAVKDGRVRKSFALISPNDTLAPEVLEALK